MSTKRKAEEDAPDDMSPATEEDAMLFKLAREGDLQKFKNLATVQKLLGLRYVKGRTLLHWVLYECYTTESYTKVKSTLEYIISTAPDLLLVKNDEGETPLSLACRKNAVPDVIKFLITSYTESINILDDTQYTPLMNFIHSLGRNFELEEIDESEILNLIQIFIDNKIDIHAESDAGHTALFLIAASYVSFNLFQSIANLLIKNGAKLRSEDGDHIITHTVTLEVAKFFLELPNNEINTPNDDGYNPLHQAVAYDSEIKLDLVKVMYEHGAIVEEDTDIIDVALQSDGCLELLNLLLDKSPEYNINSQENEPLLHKYIDYLETINKLLELGADPNIVNNKNGSTPLLSAVRVKNIEVIKTLIEAGCNPLIDPSGAPQFLFVMCDHLLNSKEETEFQLWFDLFKYILNLPVFTNTNLSQDINSVYIRIIFKLYFLYYINHSDSLLSRIENIIRFMIENNNSILTMQYRISLHRITEELNFTINVEPISCIIGTSPDIFKAYKFIIMMLDLGFPVSETPKNDITALTTLVLVYFFNGNADALIFKLANIFIDYDVNVSSYALSQNTTFFETMFTAEFNELKNTTKFPDVLLLSLHPRYNSNKYLRNKFEKHWWGPKCTIILFYPLLQFVRTRYNASELKEIDKMIRRYMCAYKGVPCHSPFLPALRSCFTNLINRATESEEYTQKFRNYLQVINNTQNSPIRLVELCKYRVKECVANRASHDESLPDILKQLLEPSLRFLLLEK